MDVSVVIVNWNTERLLLDCIQSIEDQTERRHSIIVVDNASTDRSVESVKERFPHVRVICNQRNEGFAKANNTGIRAAEGEYVCLVNSDVKVLSGCIDRLCQYMDDHPKTGIVGPQVLNRDLSIQPSCTELPSLRNTLAQALFLDRLFPGVQAFRARFMRGFDHTSERSVPALSGCFLLVRRKALTEVGLLDEKFYIYKEDVDWCKRFGDSGWGVKFYPGAKSVHYGGASSSAAPAKFMLEMEKANRIYWMKHHGWLARRVAGAISFLYYAVRLTGWTATYLARPKADSQAKEMIRKYAICMSWLGGAVPRG